MDVPRSSLGYIRIDWRVPESQPSFAVASGVTDDTVLTISGLQADTSYEIHAYVMTAQAFDLYKSSNTGAAGSLIAEGDPESKWISNLVGSGLGKSQSISLSTLSAPAPEPLPTRTPETILQPTPRPTPEEAEEEDDDLDLDTPTSTDNDGIDTPSPVTPATPTPGTPSPVAPATHTPETPFRPPRIRLHRKRLQRLSLGRMMTTPAAASDASKLFRNIHPCHDGVPDR